MMKKSILIFLLIFYITTIKAQYKKMPFDTSYYWHEYFSYYNEGGDKKHHYCEYLYKVVKDTVISSKIYKKITKERSCDFYSFYSVPQKAYLREDTILKRVIILDNSYHEHILYNFNKNIGDTAKLYNVGLESISSYSVWTYTLTTIDSTVLNDGLYHKNFTFKSEKVGGGVLGAMAEFIVIEGVGGKYGLLTPYISPGTVILPRYYWSDFFLLCLGKKYLTPSKIYDQYGLSGTCSDVIINTGIKELNAINENRLVVYPNPTHSIINITCEENVLQNSIIEIRNHLGQTVLSIPFTKQIDVSNLSNGFYSLAIKTKEGFVLNSKFIKED